MFPRSGPLKILPREVPRLPAAPIAASNKKVQQWKQDVLKRSSLQFAQVYGLTDVPKLGKIPLA